MAIAVVDSYFAAHWTLRQVDYILGIADPVMTVTAAASAFLQAMAPWKTMVGSCRPYRSDSHDNTPAEEQRLLQLPLIQEGYQTQQAVLYLHSPQNLYFETGESDGRHETDGNGGTDYLALR